MMNKPFFSIVIPTFNRAEKLRRALESIKSQTCKDFEVIVCDDGSGDATREVVAEFAEALPVTYLWEANWGGPARPRNRGITAALGEWICFLDADDWWYPEKLAVVQAVTGQADLIHHCCDVYTVLGKNRIGKRSRQMEPPIFVDLMTRGCSIVTSGTCVKKAILDKVAGFTEELDLVAVEDYDLWLRISKITEKFLYVSIPLGAYWTDQSNISSFSEKYIARESAIVCRYKEYLPRVDREEAERLLAYKIGIAKKYLGAFSESRIFLREAMRSKRLKIKLYARLYFILSLLKSRATIP